MAEAGPSSKKRKRTGKAREEAKRAAIAAKVEQLVDEEDDAVEPEPEDPVEPEPEPAGLDLDAISNRIPRGLKALHPIFKQGRMFEVRRIVKKIKFLRTKQGDQEELKNLESQLAVISHLPLDHTISSHLLIKLQKHPQLKHTVLPTSMTSQLKSQAPAASTSTQSEVLGKVENRLCSNKAVSEGVKAVVAWIMGEDGAKLPSAIKRKPQHETSPNIKRNSKVERDQGLSKPAVVDSAILVTEDDDNLDFEDDGADAAGWESGSISGSDAPPRGRARLAESGSNEDEDSDDDMAIPIPQKSSQKLSRQRDTQPLKQAKPTKPSKEPVTSSTFLPSLSTGFTLGDSDSDPDLDPDIDGSGLVGNKAVRKNRRGQRARQAIWEQKFGKHAKHVIARQRAEEDAQQAVAARANRGRGRGASGAEGPGRWSGPNGDPVATRNDAGYGARGRPFVRGGRGGTVGRPVSTHEDARPAAQPVKSVHPSWEAAKLRKQKEMGAVKPQGTKIVFD